MAKPVETLMIFATTSPFRQWLALGLGSLCCLLLHPAGLAAQGFRLGRGAAPPRAVVPAPATVTVPAAGSSAGPALREVTGRSRRFSLEVFTKADCQQCAAALKFVEQLQTRRRDLQVTITPVDTDQEQLRRYYALCKQQKVAKPGLPGIAVGEELLVGYRDDATTGRQIEDLLTIEVFTQDGCPHCAAAKRFLDGWKARNPTLPLVYRNIAREPGQLDRMREIARRHNVASPNVPLVSLFGTIQVGFDRPETTGRQLQELVEKYYPLEPDAPAAVPVRTEAGATVPPSAKPETPAPAPAESPAAASPSSAAEPQSQQPRPQESPSPAAPTQASQSGRAVPDSRTVGAGHGTSAGVPVWAIAFSLAQVEGTEQSSSSPPAAHPPGELPPLEPEELPMLDEADLDALDSPANSRDGPAADAPPDTVELWGLGSISVSRLGLPVFTVLVGLVDGFNPCAMWVLIFLLSVLAGQNDRLRMGLIAGVFVLVSGLAYFAFMSAWLTVFQLIGLVRWAQVLLGLLALTMGAIHIKDFFAFKVGVTLSIPEGAKPGLYDRIRKVVAAPSLGAALAGAIVLAVLVNVIELLCTAGLPALYTQILIYRQYPPWKNYAYLGLYNLAYMADDSLMVAIAVSTLSRKRLQEKEGRWLKLISGVVIALLGCLLLFKPEWLV
ncbi:MAG: glutaredoxin domain-containing protein [Planctomycetaceae bacterium]